MKKDFTWIISVIKSCNNIEQLDYCNILIDCFKTKHANAAIELVQYCGSLKGEIYNKKTLLQVEV